MVAAALLAVGSPPTARAANFTWNKANTDTYSWINPANWTAGAGFPDAIGDIANLNNNIAGTNTITLDANITLAGINIGDATGSDQFLIQQGIIANPSILPLAGYTSVGAGSIVLDGVGYDPLLASVAINKTGTGVADEIAALVYFNDPLTITASSGKITLSGGLRSGQSNIIFAGAGAIELKTGVLITGGNVIKNDAGTLTFTSANTYGGATTLNAGTLVAGAASVLPARTPLTVGASATFNINNQGQVVGSLAGSGLVTSSGGTAGIVFALGRDDTSTTFTGRLSPTTPANMAVTKAGAGTFTFAPSVASTYTGNTTLWGGNFLLDFVNSGANTSLLGASPLFLTGGNFTMKGRAGLATTQTLGAVTVNQMGGTIAVIAGDTSLTKLALGSIAFGASGSNAGTLLISAPTNTQVTTSTNTTLANGIYGAGRAVFFDGTNYDWLTSVSASTPFVLSGLAGASYVAFPSAGPGAATTNYLLTATQTQTAVASVGTLKIAPTAASQSLATGTFDITFGASGGGLLVTGTNAFTISGTGGLKVGASGGDLIIHNYNSGGLTISAPIKDNSTSVATRLITAGTGVTTLSGTNTFTGDVMINSGVLSFSNAGASGAGTLGLGIAKPVYIRDGATLRFTGTASATLAAATTTNSHTIWLPGGNATIEVTNAATDFRIDGVIGGTTTYSGGFTKTGPGTLTLAGGNTFTGPLIIATGKVVSGGTIATDGSTNRIADTAPVVINAGAIWELLGSDSVGSLAGAGTLQVAGTSARNPGLGADNTNTTFSGLLGGTQGNSISKRGSGVWTVAMPVTSTWVGGNTYLDAGVIRVATGMGQQFNTTATLVVNNAAQSAIFDLNGSSQTVGGLNFYNSASTIASQGLVLLGNGGTLTLGGNVTVNAHNGGGTQAAGIIGAAGSTLSMGNAQRTITVYKSLNLAPGEAELVIDAVIAGGGTGGGWLKTGGGTLRIQGQSQLNGTVATSFVAGLTILDYSTAASASVSDRLNPAGIITLQGGSVSLLGNANFDVSQSVAGMTLPTGAAGNTGGYSSIDLYSAGGKNLVLNLGSISQRLAGTVRFTLPSGAQSSVNGITTSTGNDLFTGLVGTLGAAATVTDASGATSFATRVGTNIVPVTMASRDTLSGVLNGENITDVSGYAGSLLNVVAPITLRFNAAESSQLTIPDGGILKVISGGILQTAASATSTLSLTGVNTIAGAATITATSTTGLLVGMQVSGTGIPAGARITQVVDGTTFLIDKAATATNAGTASAQALTVIQGGTLRSPTRELIISNDTLGWYPNVLGDPNSYYPTKRLLITSSIDGQQGITKTGNGVLALRAGNQANDFSGLIQLQGGVLELGRTGRGSFAVGDFAPIAFSNVDSSNLRLLQDGLTLTGGAGSTAIGSPVLKVDSIIGVTVGQALFGTGINPGTTVASLAFTGNYTSVAAVALTGAATTNTSFNVTVADTTGLVVGQPVTGTGIPAGAYITAIGNGTITLSAAATATNAGVNLNAAAVTQVTTAVNHGIANSESIVISDAATGYNGTFAVIVDPVDPKRFVFTGATGSAVVTPQTFTIDAGKRIVMSGFATSTAAAATSFQAASSYGETVGYLSGGNRQTNANFNFVDLGFGATLTMNQTADSTFAGEFMGLGNLRLIGNGTFTVNNAHRNFGNLTIDGGTFLVNSGGSNSGGRIYVGLASGNYPTITVNRYGSLYLLRSINTTTDGVGDSVDVRLNSAAGTRGNAIASSNFPDTLPLGFMVWNTYGNTGVSENINNLYFDSGTSYLTMNVSGNTRQSLGATGFLRRNNATGNVRGRSLADVTSSLNSARWWVRSGESTFTATLLGGNGADVALATPVTTAGSATITVTSTTGLALGMPVTGTGIPAGATITAINPNVSVTLSAAATVNSSGATLTAFALNKSLTPWFVGQNYSLATGPVSETDMGNSLVTYVTGYGLRPLDFATEYSTFATTLNTTDNLREVMTGNLSVGANATINALVLHNNTATNGDFAVTGAAGTSLTTGSGAFLFTLNPSATAATDNSLTLGGFDAGILLSGGANEYLFHVVNPGSSALTPRLTAIVSAPLGTAGHITKSGRGTLVLSGTNVAGGGIKSAVPTTTYWATTVNEGVLAISDLDNIGGNTGDLVLAGGTLRLLPGFSDDVSLRNVTLLSAGGTIDVGANNVTFANAIGGVAGASLGGLTKAGTGTLTLAATNTFTGATTVANGTLVVGGGANNRIPTAVELFVGSGSGSTSGILQLGDANGATNQTVSSLSGVTGLQAADITIVNPGSGFTSAPLLSFDAIGGLMGAQGAQAVATVSGGIITGITITDGGSYRPGFAPVVTVAGGGGTGASIVLRKLGAAIAGLHEPSACIDEHCTHA